MTDERPRSAYPIWLVALLSLNFGVVFFDRNALSFLMPFVQQDLVISNTQIGLLAAALSATWALSGFVIGKASDKAGRRKAYLVIAVIAFSLCSFLSGMATSFLVLLGTRLLMGVAEGPVLPISQALTAAEVPPAHRGLAMGMMQNFGSNLLGAFAAPIVLIAFAETFGWRHAFFLAGVPGLLTALAIWLYVREPDAGPRPTLRATERLTIAEAFSHRNMVLCALISVLLVACLVISATFLPLYLTQKMGFSSSVMGWLLSVLGLSAAVSSFVVPGLSDRFGRKPVMILAPLVSLVLPLSVIFFSGSAYILGIFLFVGWAMIGTFPLFMATMPSETVPPQFVATALALIMGIGEVLGGVVGPILGGLAADRFGLNAPFVIVAVFILVAVTLALGLTETNPRILQKRLRGGGADNTAPGVAPASANRLG